MTDEQYLASLFTKYGTDKGIWGYTPYYASFLGPDRMDVKRVLEIGICGYRDIPNNVVGASLFVWRDFFPNAEIFGVDADGRFIFNNQERIHTAQCDAYNQPYLHEALIGFGGEPFDIIIDDAVHDPQPQIQLMNQLSHWAAPQSFYFMEDVCPYKLPNGDLDAGMFQHITGWGGVVACSSLKPEVLVVGVK